MNGLAIIALTWPLVAGPDGGLMGGYQCQAGLPGHRRRGAGPVGIRRLAPAGRILGT